MMYTSTLCIDDQLTADDVVSKPFEERADNELDVLSVPMLLS
jgi:hypothetical protein